MVTGEPILDRRALKPLQDGFAGELILPVDPVYGSARRIWNRMIDRYPALIARVRNDEDVRRALAFAIERDLPVAIRGGGHNVAGTALVDDGVVIDQSLRRGLRVDPSSRTVEVEPGVLLGELDAATLPARLAVPSGINSTTGIAGLTLGGGIGWLMRAHGLTCDHLVAADIVTADGTHPTVTDEGDPDLMWGLRGGGGNFGIVTRFRFQAVPLPGPVLGGMLVYPMEEGEAVLRRYRDWAAGARRGMTTIVVLRALLPLPVLPTELHGRRVVAIAVCGLHEEAQDEALLRPLRGLGTLLLDSVARKPFPVHQTLFDASVPAGHGYYWKSHFIDRLTDDAIDVLIEQHRRVPAPWSYSLVPHLGGAIEDVAPDATAYPHRSPRHLVNINGVAQRPEDDEAAIAWVRETFDALAPFATGGVYVNFVGEEGEARVRAAYGAAHERLGRLKAKWDPGNVFRVNQNIRPAPPTPDSAHVMDGTILDATRGRA